MNNGKKLITISIIALLVAMLVGALAFAALSQTLKISGTGTVNGGNWNIKFDASTFASDTGGSASLTPPTISNTAISAFDVTLSNPGDYASFATTIRNLGTINAKLVDIVEPTITYNGDPDDIKIVQDNLEYTLKLNNSPAESAIGATMLPTNNITVMIMVRYSSTATSLPLNNVTINFGETALIFEQA